MIIRVIEHRRNYTKKDSIGDDEDGLSYQHCGSQEVLGALLHIDHPCPVLKPWTLSIATVPPTRDSVKCEK